MTEITQEDLLRYHYGETSEKKSAAIRAAMTNNNKVREAIDGLKSVEKALDSIKTTPSEDCIGRILQYGKNKQESRVETH